MNYFSVVPRLVKIEKKVIAQYCCNIFSNLCFLLVKMDHDLTYNICFRVTIRVCLNWCQILGYTHVSSHRQPFTPERGYVMDLLIPKAEASQLLQHISIFHDIVRTSFVNFLQSSPFSRFHFTFSLEYVL